MIEPILVDKSELEPGQWGVCNKTTTPWTLKVRRDLPECVRDFVAAHEQGHSIDPDREDWREDEREASWYAVRRYPLGCLLTVILSLCSWERIKYYLRRWKRGR